MNRLYPSKISSQNNVCSFSKTRRRVLLIKHAIFKVRGNKIATRSTQPCIPPGSLNRVPASAGVKGGNVTSAGWQVTLCDPMWHVSSRSGVATLRTAIHLLLLTDLLTIPWTSVVWTFSSVNLNLLTYYWSMLIWNTISFYTLHSSSNNTFPVLFAKYILTNKFWYPVSYIVYYSFFRVCTLGECDW